MEVTTRANTPFPTGHGAAGETTLNRAVTSVHGAVDKVAGAADDAARKVKPAIDRVAEVATRRLTGSPAWQHRLLRG